MQYQLKFAALSPLKEKEFRFFIVARFFLIMALRMLGTVAAYQLFQLTKNSFAIGLAGLSEFIPVFALALYAGYVIDKSDKRSLLLRGVIAYGICVIAMIVLTSSWGHARIANAALPLFFYGVIFCTGVIRAFTGPATSAIIAQLVQKNVLHLAANISSSTWLMASVIGHASAGFFIVAWGVHTTFYIILFYVVIAVLLIALIKKKPIIFMPKADASAWQSVQEGLRFVLHNKTRLGAISLDLFAVLFGGAVALIPEFASVILKTGAIGFGWLNAAMDIGSLCMISFFTLRPIRKNQGQLLLYVVAGFGVCIIVFGLSTWYWLSFMALLVAGMLDGISVIVRGTILQLTTPDDKRGRVSSVNSLFINSSNELGQFESGFTARFMGGAIPAVVFGGCMTLLVVLITWIKAPTLRKFEW
jgi:MFS family permease